MLNENCVVLDSCAPKWLDPYFMEKSFRSYFRDNSIEVKSISVKPCVAKGDNFASEMYRVTVKYLREDDQMDKTTSCVVKTSVKEGFSLSVLSQFNIYSKENEMYETILPQMKLLLKNAKLRSDIFPATYYVSNSNNAIVLEDLLLKGYCMPSRLNGLDIHHTRIVLNKLAKFHAASAVLKSQQPNVFKNFKNGMLNRATSGLQNFYLFSFDELVNVVSGWPNYQYYAEKLRKLRPHLLENGKRAFDSKNNSFNALIHGDIWVNNTMFTYTSDNIPERMMLLDFQYCCWTSPTIDLHYFFNTSLTEDLRIFHQEELLQYYHRVLVKTLKSLQYPDHIPNLLEFNMQFLENSFYALTSALLVQPIMIDDQGKDIDIDHLLVDGEKSANHRKMVYSNEVVQRNIKVLLPIFDRRGILDLC